MSRERSRTVPYPSGGVKYQTFGGSVYNVVYDHAETYGYISNDYCRDTVGHPELDNLLEINHRVNSIKALNGSNGDPWWGGSHWQNYFSPAQTIGTPAHLDVPMPSVDVSATSALAVSNPNRPTVSLPNFLFELKDLPGMLKEIGSIKLGAVSHLGSAKDFANKLLSAQMGWRPLISDVAKLVTFAEATNKRLKVLDAINANGGLRRSVKSGIGGGSAQTSVPNQYIESSGAILICTKATKTEVKRWATVRWFADHGLNVHLNSTPSLTLARNLVLGRQALSAEQIWDAIPWSWLIDYFSTVGDFLGAYSNAVPVYHGAVNIMTTTETTEEWIRTDGNTNVTGGDGTKTFVTKARAQGVAVLTATIPFLGAGQLSTLGALAVQRFR